MPRRIRAFVASYLIGLAVGKRIPGATQEFVL